ncbi:MAG: NAD-dependent epimerase/dehydratase family protein [Flammeovirgaceae bacterium]|nr:NAD-dependent epimerase/dehydratase family protein [Flammeovirgaceae bacterium]
MVNCALEKKAKRFIHTSYIAVYGFQTGTIDETTLSTAMKSEINYFKTKYLAEIIVKKAIAEKGLDAIILNPCHLMGTYDQYNWVQLIQSVNQDNLPGIPPATGLFCHVEEVAKAHISAFEKGITGENYILAGG